MYKEASVQRVARLYLSNLAQEKSLNLQIDEKFKSWKGKNPNNNNPVGYWTVKGWKQFSKKQISKSPEKAKLKEYAEKAFEAFEKALREDNSKAQKDMLTQPNFGLPEEVLKENKFALEVEKPSKEDIKELAKSLRKGFKTPGFERGAMGQLVATLGTDEWGKRLTSMVVKPLQGVVAKLSKDDDVKQAIREAKESNPEVAGAAKNLAANWTQSTIIPMITSSLGFGGLSIGAGVQSLVVGGLNAVGVAGATSATGAAIATAAPLVASLAVGTVMYKKLFHERSKKTKGKLKGLKSKDLPDNYDNLASDIYAGYATPESVEAEYNQKLDKILNDSNLSPEEARKKIIELYEDFDQNARPAIDKGLYQLGATEGSGKLDFLKRGSDKGTPVLIKLLKLKDQYDATDQITTLIEEDQEGVADLLQKVLSGEEEIPKELMEALNGASSNPSKQASLKASSERLARRYLGL